DRRTVDRSRGRPAALARLEHSPFGGETADAGRYVPGNRRGRRAGGGSTGGTTKKASLIQRDTFMKFLAIMRDSLREAIDSKVFFVMVGLSGVFILLAFTLSF